jgi:hypothetical protein
MNCAACKNSLRKLVSVVVEMPVTCYEDGLELFRRPDISIRGANWRKQFLYCPHCGWEQSSARKPRTSAPPPADVS